jgi:hypothetical protein
MELIYLPFSSCFYLFTITTNYLLPQQTYKNKWKYTKQNTALFNDFEAYFLYKFHFLDIEKITKEYQKSKILLR